MIKEDVDYNQMNGIALAYMGDAIYEIYIRRHLLAKGLTKPTKLHHKATHYVSAKAQAFLIEKMQEQNVLNDEELEFFKRGRNAKSHTSAKNTSVVTYRISSSNNGAGLLPDPCEPTNPVTPGVFLTTYHD